MPREPHPGLLVRPDNVRSIAEARMNRQEAAEASAIAERLDAASLSELIAYAREQASRFKESSLTAFESPNGEPLVVAPDEWSEFLDRVASYFDSLHSLCALMQQRHAAGDLPPEVD